MASLAGLGVGERWIYSPRLDVLDRGVTPALATFDSSRTPVPGERIAAPRTLAELDVSAIAEALAPPVPPGLPDASIPAEPLAPYEKDNAVGPRFQERNRRIAALEREAADLTAANTLLSEELDRLQRTLRRIHRLAGVLTAEEGPVDFPRKVRLGSNSVGWWEGEINAWKARRERVQLASDHH